jgi:hypothetical protein
MIDTLVYEYGAERELPLAGWACRETNVRPALRFSAEVVEELRFCFDQKQRMNSHEIEKHLRTKFRYGPRCLRMQQISGWITSEVDRRKKKALKSATAVVAAAFKAPEVPEGAASEGAAGAESESNAEAEKHADASDAVTAMEKAAAQADEARQRKKDARKTADARRRIERATALDLLQQIAIGALSTAEIEEAEVETARARELAVEVEQSHKVIEVVNKRGRRYEYEYECRWSGCAADDTTWESMHDLISVDELQAVDVFECTVKKQRAGLISCGEWERPILTECCHTIVEYETYDECTKKCVDPTECAERQQVYLGQSGRGKRQKKAPAR